jgi:RHS repeat-associated protein
MLNNHTLCFQFDRPYRAGGRLLRNITAVASTNSTISSPIQLTVTAGVAQVYYIHTDQLNTPRLITNSANAKVWEWNNDDPFANNVPKDDPNATGNHFTYNPRLPGQYFDSETNTNYNYFRDYDPSTGRYIESDPIGLEGGINTYGYVGGNPIGAVDPRGLETVVIHTSDDITPKLPVNQCTPNDCKTIYYKKYPLTCHSGIGRPEILWIGTCSPYVIYVPEECFRSHGSGIRG